MDELSMDDMKERFLYLSRRTKEVMSFYTQFFMTEEFEDPDMTITALEGMNQLGGAMHIVTNIELSKESLDAYELLLAKHEGIVMNYPLREVGSG